MSTVKCIFSINYIGKESRDCNLFSGLYASVLAGGALGGAAAFATRAGI